MAVSCAASAGQVRANPIFCPGSIPRSAASFRASATPFRVRVSTLNGLPLGPVARVSWASPSRIQAFTARRVV